MSPRVLSTGALDWLRTILRERFGHDFQLEAKPGLTSLRLPGHAGSIDFDTTNTSFAGSAQALPCPSWSPSAEGLVAPLGRDLPAPGLSRQVQPLVESSASGHTVHYDVLGLVYWMLARIEELNSSNVDAHGRFPSTASHAVRHGYLERPLVDEWLAVLGPLIAREFPGIALTRHSASQRVSHDVDHPSRYGFCTPYTLIKAIGGDILRRRDFRSVYRAPILRLGRGRSLNRKDPYHSFEWIMDVSERQGLKSAFYFICGRTSKKDAAYEPDHPAIRELMRQIHARGHEIGLHPSYGTFRDPDVLAGEASRLKRICAEEGIAQSEWGGRMHFLRWQSPITLHGWVRGGMTYESSLGYADAPGFRAGTCHEYPAFDAVEQKALPLRLRPLIAMECTIIGPRYLALGTGEPAYQRFAELKAACRAVGGCFTLLWHNSRFTPAERVLYQRVLSS
ncbi:MAG TPA: polysaccharide deacetylase family protein [Polyangiaceae bacterium]|nr:polysaccharide deacetylase family protein [Polyangiaceae bacterium]